MSVLGRNWRFFSILCAWVVLGSPVLWGQLPDTGLPPLAIPGISSDRPEDLVSFSGEYRLRPDNKSGVLSIKASLQPTWHIYSTTQKAGGPMASRIKVSPSDAFQLERPFTPDRTPHVRPADLFPVPSEEFSEEVVWSAPFQITGGADPQKLNFAVTFDGQICQDGGSCIPISKVAIPVKFAGEAPAVRRGEYSNPRVHATLNGTIEPRSVLPGETVRLKITATPAPKFHVYALAERDPLKVSKPALIAWKQKPDWTTSKPVPSEPPTEHPGLTAQEPLQYYYENPVTWTIELQVPADAAPGGYELRGLVGYQTCTKTNCDPPAGAEFSATVAVVKDAGEVDAAPEALAFKPSSYAVAAKLAAEAADASGSGDGVAATAVPERASPPAPEPVESAAPQPPAASADYGGPLLEIAKLEPNGTATEERSMLVVLPMALLAGFILNFMPCVLPVIGLKVVAFVQQAGHSRSRIFWLNLWYCLGLLSVFLVLASLAVFAEFSWGKQFQSATFNIVLASVVFAFALSFLGVWEIPVPGFVGNSGANKMAEQEGPVGAFFKGTLTTVLATPCSGPMLVPALAWAMKQPPALTYLTFLCVGLGMAAPYLLVGIFPRLIAFLPKPGEWMETFKQLMGFVLLGTVVFLLTFIPTPLVVPTVAFMIGLWAALWWVGRVPVWDDLNKRVRAWAFGLAFAVGIGMFAFNWLHEVMESRFQRDVAAAAPSGPQLDPSQFASANAPATSVRTELTWKPYSLPLLSKLLLEEKKTVFVDFTADWCWNCKANERFALNVPETKAFVEANGIETIKADMTYEAPHIEELLRQLAGSAAIPVYAIFDPRDPYRPLVIEGLLTQSRVIEALAQASPENGSLLSGREVARSSSPVR